jgi:hypothetical protein
MSLNERQYQVLNAIERASSIISLAASSFVVASFIKSSRFRTPINRLIFYATLGNVLINAATLIASSGISRGVESPLCQFQAFALQWFAVPGQSLYLIAYNKSGSCQLTASGRFAWRVIFTSLSFGDTMRLSSKRWNGNISCFAT